jgi:soluble lytic murein transglycosylase-like protein
MRLVASRFVVLAIATLGVLTGSAAAQVGAAKPASSTSMRCIAVAAKYHKVNHAVLSAILKVESSYNPGAVNRNADGSVDVGIGQMNSIHFKELATHGITPTDLMDPCVGSYVAAWHLGRQIQLHGNTWFAIGAYHSAMVDMRAVPGPKVVVVTPKTPYPP